MDVRSAFLNGDLKEEIYMEKPLFEVQGKEHLVCRFKKALYGLKQSPIAWYEKIDAYLLKNAFTKSSSYTNIYVKVVKG